MRDENERVRLTETVMEISTSIHSHFHHFYLVTFASELGRVLLKKKVLNEENFCQFEIDPYPIDSFCSP